MPDQTTSFDLGIASRIRRSRGRGGRVYPVTSKLTREERDELTRAATREGKDLGEWARDVLLSHVHQGRAEAAAFTELIALRMLLNAVLRSIVVGKKMSESEYNTLLTELRKTKHATAQDVLTQYETNAEGAQ